MSACFLPAILFWVASVSDNDQFYFGDAWLEAHGGARRALTGPVFLAQRMFTCRSDVDAKSYRQILHLGCGLKLESPLNINSLNPNSHMTAVS